MALEQALKQTRQGGAGAGRFPGVTRETPEPARPDSPARSTKGNLLKGVLKRVSRTHNVKSLRPLGKC